MALTQRLTKAEAAFNVQNYPRVIELLNPLTDAKFDGLKRRAEYLRVLEWLGASQWLSGQQDTALQFTFTELLTRWPRHRLDELVYPDALIREFDRQRDFLIRYRIIDPFATPSSSSVSAIVKYVETPTTPTIAYFAPFGVGQFANDQDGKGTVVAALQGIGIVTAAVTWLAVEDLKTNGVVSANDEGAATALRALWIAGATLFTASYIYGVADGLVNRQTEPTVRLKREFIDKDEVPGDVLSPGSVSFDVVPLPDGAAVGLHGTF